jgi:2-polyprenyl-3-methyl-5-hydroxy-6-metoxy-1,4-benzoquinol methylase
VLDAACGVGYGTGELASAAELAIGIDISPRAVATARAQFGGNSTRFAKANLETDDLRAVLGQTVDAVVSFETLEHLGRPEVALSQFAALLRPGASLICSVPSALHESRTAALLPRNRRHRQLFSFDALARMLDRTGFEIEYRLGQSLATFILRRESDLVRRGVLKERLSTGSYVHGPQAIRWFASVLAYPTVENVDASYSMVAVATRR